MKHLNKIIKYLFGLLLFTQVSCQKATENKKNMDREKFVWEEQMSAPLGYPVEVYKGGIGFKSLTNGICTGKYGWGSPKSGMSKSSDWMPQFLNVTWLSYAEDCFYHIETPIDHEKLYDLFKKGFDYKVSSGSGEIRHGTYDGICTGFAPGGVVVVWAVAASRQTEIGRYKAEKIVIPESEISHLDSHQRLLFDPKFKDGILTSKDVIPLKVQGENKNKPIPFGLWDNYRIRYNWKPTFVLSEGSVLNENSELGIDFLNGESSQIFNELFPLKNFESNAAPKALSFSWKSKDGTQYAGNCTLEETSSFKAFKEIYGEQPEKITADLEIKVNMANNFFTVMLKGSNGKEVFIKTDSLEVFKVKQYK